MNNRVVVYPGSKVLFYLLTSGWFPFRWSRKILRIAQSQLGRRWLDSCASFVGSFGGLSLDGVGGVDATLGGFLPIDEIEINIVEKVIGEPVCPLAFASYIGQGGTLYITVSGTYFVANVGEVVYLGNQLNAVLKILLCYTASPPVPERWAESLRKFNFEQSLLDNDPNYISPYERNSQS